MTVSNEDIQTIIALLRAILDAFENIENKLP